MNEKMDWYNTLPKDKKIHIREVFELATGQSLNNMMKLFTFSECMDILRNKLVLEGFIL